VLVPGSGNGDVVVVVVDLSCVGAFGTAVRAGVPQEARTPLNATRVRVMTNAPGYLCRTFLESRWRDIVHP
jgi:hypothetical protein